MLEPPDEVFDESGTDLSPGEREGRGAAERPLGRGEPAAGRPVVSFEEFEGAAEDAGGPEQSVGLLGAEFAFALTAVQRARRDTDELCQLARGQADVAAEALEGAEGEAGLDQFEQAHRVFGLQAEERDVIVAPAR